MALIPFALGCAIAAYYGIGWQFWLILLALVTADGYKAGKSAA